MRDFVCHEETLLSKLESFIGHVSCHSLPSQSNIILVPNTVETQKANGTGPKMSFPSLLSCWLIAISLCRLWPLFFNTLGVYCSFWSTFLFRVWVNYEENMSCRFWSTSLLLVWVNYEENMSWVVIYLSKLWDEFELTSSPIFSYSRSSSTNLSGIWVNYEKSKIQWFSHTSLQLKAFLDDNFWERCWGWHEPLCRFMKRFHETVDMSSNSAVL